MDTTHLFTLATTYAAHIGRSLFTVANRVGVQLPQSLKRWERVHNRILDWEAAQPADQREVAVLAQLKCPGLQLSDDVIRHTLTVSDAVARRVVSNLAQVKDYARIEGIPPTRSGDDCLLADHRCARA